MAGRSVLLVGLEPELIDFSQPDYARFPGLDAGKVRAALRADEARLRDLGYDAQTCLTDLGDTAEATLRAHLGRQRFDAVMIGAGVRMIPGQTRLFEMIVNLVREHAPHAKLCFNTQPSDTAEAVQRWV